MIVCGFEPIWAAAEELGVSVILHPTDVKTDVAKEYYQGENIDPIISIMLPCGCTDASDREIHRGTAA